MRTSQMTAKGQVTIPVEIRSALSLKQGDRVGFIEIEKDRFAIVSANFPVQRLKGLVRKPNKPVSIESMNAAISARGAKE